MQTISLILHQLHHKNSQHLWQFHKLFLSCDSSDHVGLIGSVRCSQCSLVVETFILTLEFFALETVRYKIAGCAVKREFERLTKIWVQR